MVFCKRSLHCKHVASLLDAVCDAALMFCRKASYLAWKDFTRLRDETGKLINIVERVVHRIEGAIGSFFVCAH